VSSVSFVLSGFAALLAATQISGGPAQAERAVAVLANSPAVKAALAGARTGEPATVDLQVRLAQIPAPPFKESVRAQELRRLFVEAGLKNVRIDRVGNVVGDRPGSLPHPHVVIAAHLDTVFPEGTDVRVRRDGPVLHGPGVGDDSRGLAMLVAAIRAMNAANIRTDGPLTFVADVGEEGLGDLRGMKELFDVTLKGQADRFVAVDGAGMGIASTFVASRRYRVTFSGPGGHSFGDFGLASPVDALARAVTKISAIPVPAEPKTTFNVGRIGGGTAVNAIPADAWMELDLRSADRRALAALDASVKSAISAAVSETGAGRRGAVAVKSELLGERPGGALPADSPLVLIARAATHAVGGSPIEAISSSDANYPMSLGIPSIELATGGRGAGTHSINESFDTTNSALGTERLVLVAIALAQR